MNLLAILGSYRPDHTIDQAADAILSAAHAAGAKVERIQLRDHHIEFCTNCRACMQEPGETPGSCPLSDDMAEIVRKIELADTLLLASPVNCGTVTALYKRFQERSVVYGHWPWGMNAPKMRQKKGTRKAVLLTASGAPAILTRLFSDGVKRLRESAILLGAKPVGSLVVGLASGSPRQALSSRVRKKAQRLGVRMVT